MKYTTFLIICIFLPLTAPIFLADRIVSHYEAEKMPYVPTWKPYVIAPPNLDTTPGFSIPLSPLNHGNVAEVCI